MPLFAYRAIDTHGRRQRGTLEAANAADLEMRLKRMGLDFIDGAPFKTRLASGRTRVPRRELIHFCFHLEQLASAGVPILEGLTDLRDSVAHPRFREVLSGMIESIDGGSSLSQSMENHPRVFDEVFVSLIRAGENTGRLPEILMSLADTLKWQDELAAHGRKIVMYPAFLGTAVLAVIFFMMIYLVPKMAAFIGNLGQVLPMHTRALIAVSDFFVHYWAALLASPVLLVFAFLVAIHRSLAVRRGYDQFKLALPLLGDILNKIALSRFASVFAMLYAAKIPILDAVRATEGVVGNAVIRSRLQRAGQLIGDGQNISGAFHEAGMFPPLVVRMLRIGENSGALDKALNNVSYFYNRDVKESIERLQGMIEPALTLVVGLILGWVMIAVLGPIYDIITKLKT